MLGEIRSFRVQFVRESIFLLVPGVLRHTLPRSQMIFSYDRFQQEREEGGERCINSSQSLSLSLSLSPTIIFICNYFARTTEDLAHVANFRDISAR